MKIVNLLIVSFLIRLISLSQSFWLDEAISANVIKNYSFFDIINTFSPQDFHPPLFYLLLKAWSLVFGTSVIGLRLFSVTASVLAGLFVYKTAKLLFNHKTALWSTALFLFNPLFVYYSQELRMYSLVTLFLSIATYYYFSLTCHPACPGCNIGKRSEGPRMVLLFNLFIFLSFLVFYGSIFYIFSLYLLLFIQKKYQLLFKLLPGFILSLLLLSPLLYRQIFLSKTLLADVANWSLVLGKSNLKNLLLIPLKFSFGRISFYPKSVYYLLSGFWSIFIFKNIFPSRHHQHSQVTSSTSRHCERRQAISSFLFLLFFPVFLAFLISFKLPMLQYFRYLYLLPIFSIILSASKSKFVILFGFTILSLVYLLNTDFHREDWQSLTKSLPQNTTIYMIPSFADPLNYYRPDIKISDIRTIAPKNQSASVLENYSAKELFVVPYGFDIFGFNHTDFLSSQNLSYSNTQNFRQISLETWVTKD